VTGSIELPGLVDLQVNGAHGIDITAEPSRLWEVAAVLPAYGVTAFLPTVITASASTRSEALAALAAGRPPDVPPGAVPLGLHFEGPMIAESHKGAHPAEWLAVPSTSLIEGWSREAGVAMVTLAPELPGALEVIEELVSRGVVVSIGHTAATSVSAAVAAGARCVTHLFNAMPPLHHRDLGPVGAALAGDLVAGVIVDGHHLDDAVARMAWQLLAPERFLLVSDATAALGAPGPSVLGSQSVSVVDSAVRLADGTLAGSSASLLDCMRRLVQVTGCSLESAAHAAHAVPLELLGVERGQDVVVLSPSLEVVRTVVDGEVVYEGVAA